MIRVVVVAVLALALSLSLSMSLGVGPVHATEDFGALSGGAPPLDGRTVVVDAGHQLGNYRHPKKIRRLVPAGGFKKPCNTVGSRTHKGIWEATLVWRVSRALVRRLEKQGARVLLTRTSNRKDRWGPCVNVRGRRGNKVDADLKISIHGDGAAASARGFHVIRPTDRPKWTRDIVKPSRRLARLVKASLVARRFRVAEYVAGGTGIDARGDLATLNLSDVPTVMVELGNLRNRRDARVIGSKPGRKRYAGALMDAVRAFLG